VNSGFRVFDTHTHVGTAWHSGRSLRAEELLASMDRFGVDRSVVIPFPVVADYRGTHDEIGRAVAAHPDRLVGAACMDPFIPEQAFRDEVRRCAQVLGFRALKLQPQYQALNPLSSRSEFFFETAIENHLAAICHTGSGVPFALPSLFIWPARQFPELPIILAHSGGGLFVSEAIVAASVCPNIYLELSSLMPHHIADVLAHVPSSHLMIGSDLPESLETEMSKIVTLETTREVKADILWNTAARLFAPAG
jgi:predicted TIM-barrel fold metal-dependent hydrolase